MGRLIRRNSICRRSEVFFRGDDVPPLANDVGFRLVRSRLWPCVDCHEFFGRRGWPRYLCCARPLVRALQSPGACTRGFCCPGATLGKYCRPGRRRSVSALAMALHSATVFPLWELILGTPIT